MNQTKINPKGQIDSPNVREPVHSGDGLHKKEHPKPRGRFERALKNKKARERLEVRTLHNNPSERHFSEKSNRLRC